MAGTGVGARFWNSCIFMESLVAASPFFLFGVEHCLFILYFRVSPVFYFSRLTTRRMASTTEPLGFARINELHIGDRALK